MVIGTSNLLQQFEAQEIDAGNFGHRQHLEVAYQMLQNYDYLETCFKYSNGIKTFATNAGVPEKFNITVTFAFLSVIAERMHSSTHTSFNEFLENNQDLLSGNLLNHWYTNEQLNSESARLRFLMPDVNQLR